MVYALENICREHGIGVCLHALMIYFGRNHLFCKKNITFALMASKQSVAYFISFCVEQYKTAKGLSGADTVRLFDKYNIPEYLEENFEPLHTQSRQWLIEEIDEFIKLRQKAS